MNYRYCQTSEEIVWDAAIPLLAMLWLTCDMQTVRSYKTINHEILLDNASDINLSISLAKHSIAGITISHATMRKVLWADGRKAQAYCYYSRLILIRCICHVYPMLVIMS